MAIQVDRIIGQATEDELRELAFEALSNLTDDDVIEVIKRWCATDDIAAAELVAQLEEFV